MTTGLLTPITAPADARRKRSLDPRLCAFAESVGGRILLVLGFTVLLKSTHVMAWWETGVFLLLMSLLPQWRKPLVGVAAICWIFISPPLLINPLYKNQAVTLAERHDAAAWVKFWPGEHIAPGTSSLIVANLGLAAIVGAVLLWGYGYVRFTRAFPKLIVSKWPIGGLIVLMLALLWVQEYLKGFAWFAVASFELVLGHYIWFFAYTLAELRTTMGKPTPIQPCYWRYFWAVNKCPIGKGAQYLDRSMAKSKEELAASQLSGMKLILWAILLSGIRIVLKSWLYGPRSDSITSIPGWHPAGWLPLYNDALDHAIAGHPYPWHIRWLVLIGQFIYLVMDLAVWAHKMIAVARMAGYNVFRNMYWPMTSVSLAEFYNRFHWYFKEMLVTFFFFPTYLRWFRKHPRLRVFVATVAAAGWGNYIYHFLHYDRNIYEFGLWRAFSDYRAYGLYTSMLALGIGISQFRVHGKKIERPTGFRKLRAIAGVLFFFMLIGVIDEGSTMRTMGDYWVYWKGLFIP